MKAYRSHVLVCAGTGCVSNNSFKVKEALEHEVERQGLKNEVLVVATGCQGFCAVGPIVIVQPDGTFYCHLQEKDASLLVEEHLLKGRPVPKLMYTPPAAKAPVPALRDIPFFARQTLLVMRNRAAIDPEKIDDYIANDGYTALSKAVTEMAPEEVIDVVKRSGLRGRGGGGFPAGVKWETCRNAARERGAEPVIVCNADEGDPGAFMDRSIIESDPHTVIEGMIIGARAIGAKEGYIYVRYEYPLARQRFAIGLEQAREYGLLGSGILGSDMDFDITIRQGGGAFVCGESTALMASLEGRVGEPRAKYIHTVEHGYENRPTTLNNVETLANVPMIINRGPEWFASIGTGDVSENPWNGSSGTKVFSLVGNVSCVGLIEVPMGLTLREIIFEIGGGIPKGRKFKAVQTGGPSGGCLPDSALDMRVDFDTLTEAGSMMGSGGMIVMDDHTCMVDVARYFVDFLADESCGKCLPCREGLRHMSKILTRIQEGEGRESDVELLEQLSETMANTCLCALGTSAPNPVLSTLKYFKDEYLTHIRDKKCPGGVCKALVTYSIDSEKCTGCHLCLAGCPVECITGEPKKPHVIDQANCIKCDSCFEVCKQNAVLRL